MTPTRKERREFERRAQFGNLIFRTPEKHYVRLNGWVPVCRAMKEHLRDEDLRYFSLCGREPFDVILLFRERILIPNRMRPNVAICDVETEALTAASEAITRAKFGPVAKFSISLEDLVLGQNDLHDQFLGILPFHVYNFDFTKQIFYYRRPIRTRMWKTIERVIELQSQHNQDFDLFVTSRSYPPEINQNVVRILLDTMNHNIRQVAGLLELINVRGINSFDELFQQDFTEFFLRSLPKQILQKALDCGFLLRLHGLYRYKKPGYHIAKWCLGFRRPQKGKPRLSIGNSFSLYGFENYCETSLAVVRNEIHDATFILNHDTEQREKMH